MAERIVRLYGPDLISKSVTSPTTMFTVPTAKTYVVRSVSASILAQVTDVTTDASLAFGITDLSIGSIIGGLNVTAVVNGIATDTLNLTTPIVAGESLVGAFSYVSSGTTDRGLDYFSSNTTAWDGVNSTTDAASYASAAFTPQASLANTNMYFCVVNSKATTPDVVSSITDNHTNPYPNISSISTAATSTIRASIWGAYTDTAPTAATTYTVAFGGTQTGCFADAVAPNNVGGVVGTPSTGTNLVQIATATGTTELAQGVTMTPYSALDTWQLLVVGCTGVASSYTGPTNSTEIADGNHATPNDTAAIYFIYPATSNPSATIAGAGTSWAAVCLEGVAGVAPTVTVSGIVIEP